MINVISEIPLAPNVNVGRFVGCLGPSKISKASLSNFFEYFLTASARLGELSSSSKSIMTLILYFSSISFLLIISNALRIIITGPFASEADLAKILKSFS